jgi:probable rRNA maturation factor
MAAAIEQRQRRVPVSVASLRRAVERALAAVGRPAGVVEVRVVDDAEMRALNADWRGIQRRTDVLAFPLETPGEPSQLVGQVVISADAAARQARRLGVPLGVELDLLATHGTLHLVGWDDRDPVEADLMHRRERQILGRTPARLWSGLLNDDGRSGGSEPRAPRTGLRSNAERSHSASRSRLSNAERSQSASGTGHLRFKPASRSPLE